MPYISLTQCFNSLTPWWNGTKRHKAVTIVYRKRERRLLQQIYERSFAITDLDNLQLQFNPPLWHTTVDHVTVYADERLVFHFKNGSEVEAKL